MQAFLRHGPGSDRVQSKTVTHLPCEVGNNLFQPVFITDDHPAMIDDAPMDVFPALFHRSNERPPSDLLVIKIRDQLDLLTVCKTHLINGAVQVSLKLQSARICIKLQGCEERFHDFMEDIGLEVK